jgi:hypothetical protein
MMTRTDGDALQKAVAAVPFAGSTAGAGIAQPELCFRRSEPPRAIALKR